MAVAEAAFVESAATEVLDHVPDDVSNALSDNDDSTATVDGETPSEALAADINLDLAALESTLDEPTSTTEVIDHVPDDVSNVSSDNDDSAAAVDGETPSEALAADIDLDMVVAEAAFVEPAATDVLDHVPDDISNVTSSDNDDSTAAVDGETPSEALAADIDLDMAVAESELEKPIAGELLDHVPDDISNVSLSENDDSTATVDGETPSEALESDIGLEVTEQNDGETVDRNRIAKPWDESDELMTGHRSGSDTELPTSVEATIDEDTDIVLSIPLATGREGLTRLSGSGEAEEDAAESPGIPDSNQDVDDSTEAAVDKVVAASIEEIDSQGRYHHDVTKGTSTDTGLSCESVSDDAAVLGVLHESQTPEVPSKSLHADGNDCIDETEIQKDMLSASSDDADSQDKAVFDALLASRDDTRCTDEETSKEDNRAMEAVVERGLLLSEEDLTSSETITDEYQAETTVAEQTESDQIPRWSHWLF